MASSEGYYILAYKFLYHDEAQSHKSACEVQNLCSFSRNDNAAHAYIKVYAINH